MLEFNDQLKNDVIRAIVALINDPKSGDVYQQATHLLKIISDSGSQVDKDNALAKFIEPYITSSMIYAPSFSKGILFPDKALDPKTVVRLLSRLRFDALKADNSEIIIESLTYFIDVFSLAFNVNSSIFEKCTINYADHSKDFPKAVYYAFEAYSAPIGVLFKSKEEWESYKQLTKELQCEHSFYTCQLNETGTPAKLKSQDIDELTEDKYPVRIRLNRQQMYKPDTTQDSPDFIVQKSAAERIVGLQTIKNLETPSKKQSKRKKLIVILASVLCLLGGVWTYFHYRDADIEDWVVGFWTYDDYGCDLFVDSAGNGYIDVYNEYWWNSRLSKLICSCQVRYNKITGELWVDNASCGDKKNPLQSFINGKLPIEVDSRNQILTLDGKLLEKQSSEKLPRWLAGEWVGSKVDVDEFGLPVQRQLKMFIDVEGKVELVSIKNGTLEESQVHALIYDKSLGLFYIEKYGVRVNYYINGENRTISNSDFEFHRK